jgi:hypothetical protein
MTVIRLQITGFLILVFTLLSSDGAWAQAPLEPAQMSSRTVFYLTWHGAPAGEARKNNSLLALWDDPGLAPMRAAMLPNMQGSDTKESTKPQLSPAEIEETSGLLENAFVLGYLRKPEAKTVPDKANEHWNGMFFVYDRTGKEMLLAKTVLRFRSKEKEAQQISTITVAGAPALKITGKDGSTYWTERGKYAVGAAELGVFEDILARLDGKSIGASLAQTAAYQEAQPQLQGGLLEFFLRVPQLKEFTPDTRGKTPFKIEPLLDALKIDSVHSISGRLTLEGAKSRVQGAVLGDTAAGTLFDLWDTGQTNPSSLAFVTPDVISYSETQFNFSAFYALLKRALHVALPPQQQGMADMMEGFAATRIGMPLPDALALLSGEFASIQTNPGLDPQKAVYYLGIRNKQNTLKLLRTIFSDQLGAERNEGETTYLKVSLGGGQNSTGIAQWNFYHLAVTPTFVIASSRGETLHEALAKARSGGAAVSVLPAAFQAERAKFPAALNGFAFMNLQNVDYQAVKTRWIEESRKAAKTAAKRTDTATEQSRSKQAEWLQDIDPQVFARHLHYLAGGSWKDAKGIHFDEWLQ